MQLFKAICHLSSNRVGCCLHCDVFIETMVFSKMMFRLSNAPPYVIVALGKSLNIPSPTYPK